MATTKTKPLGLPNKAASEGQTVAEAMAALGVRPGSAQEKELFSASPAEIVALIKKQNPTACISGDLAVRR